MRLQLANPPPTLPLVFGKFDDDTTNGLLTQFVGLVGRQEQVDATNKTSQIVVAIDGTTPDMVELLRFFKAWLVSARAITGTSRHYLRRCLVVPLNGSSSVCFSPLSITDTNPQQILIALHVQIVNETMDANDIVNPHLAAEADAEVEIDPTLP